MSSEGTTLHKGWTPELGPGEALLRLQYLWLVSTKSLPYYRIHIPIPGLVEMQLLVSDQRIVFAGGLFFRLIGMRFSIWYRSHESSPEAQVLTGITEGRGWLGVPYVEILSETEKKKKFRSRQLRTRVYGTSVKSLGIPAVT